MDIPVADLSYEQLERLSNPRPPAVAKPITEQCRDSVSKKYNIPEYVLDAFLATEGGTPGHIRKNTNGSVDVGPMQINSINWPQLYQKLKITPAQLRWDGCANLTAGATLIREKLDSRKDGKVSDMDDLLTLLASYHSKTKRHNERYKGLLQRHLKTVDIRSAQ